MNQRNVAESIFNDALSIDENQRDQFLSDACGNDKELRAEIENLIDAHEQLGSFMTGPAISMPTNLDTPTGAVKIDTKTSSSATATSGDQIGPYVLREQIGEGGFGLVFVAEQLQPVRRKLALKIIKPGMDSRQIIARFSAERQTLALMEHPNIARVIDAGTTDKGRMYFVMELVRGIPITEYCDQRRLSIDDRLKLFIDVCKAIEHAHQKGIIHRDIKPANVLVAPYDGRPVVKVIDFGVAKALNQHLTDQSVYTNVAQVIGTPLYMSPEQAETNNLDVDTRSDIYALGILLYELLTGTTPIERDRVLKANMEQIQQIIRNEEPPRPSSRFAKPSKEISAVAEQRQTEPMRLARTIRGDLDWIVMKCLEKDRCRRYDSAGALGNEIQRFLDKEPVLAGPPTTGYRLKKLADKHRAALAMVAITFGIILTGTSVAVWQAVRATRSATSERMAKEQSEQRLTHLEKTYEILDTLFDGLDSNTDGANKKPVRVVLGQRLSEMLAKLESESDADRLVIANQQGLLGRALIDIGNHNEGIATLEKAYKGFVEELGNTHLDTLRSQIELGDAYCKIGRFADGMAMLEPAIFGLISELGSDHEEVLRANGHLGWSLYETGKLDDGKQLLEITLAKCKTYLDEDSVTTADCMMNLAHVCEIEGRLTESAELYAQALEVIRNKKGEDHPETLMCINQLAEIHSQSGDVEKAAKLTAEALAIHKRTLGEDHPDTLLMTSSLARMYEKMGKYDEAIPLAEWVYLRRKSLYGDDDPGTLLTMGSLGTAYLAGGEIENAHSILQQASEKFETTFGATNRQTLNLQKYLGQTYVEHGHYEEGANILQKAAESLETEFGPQHLHTMSAISRLTKAYNNSGQYAKALPWYEKLIEGCEAAHGSHDSMTILTKMTLVTIYLRTDHEDKALTLLKETYPHLVSFFGVTSPRTCQKMDNVAMAYLDTGDPQSAVEWLDRQIGDIRETADSDLFFFTKRLTLAGEIFMDHEQPEFAEAYLRESIEIGVQLESQKDSNTVYFVSAKALLGISLADQAKRLGQRDSAVFKNLIEEAEPLLIAGYEGLQQHANADNQSVTRRMKKAAQKLIEIYQADPAQNDLVAKWQEKSAVER